MIPFPPTQRLSHATTCSVAHIVQSHLKRKQKQKTQFLPRRMTQLDVRFFPENVYNKICPSAIFPHFKISMNSFLSVDNCTAAACSLSHNHGKHQNTSKIRWNACSVRELNARYSAASKPLSEKKD